MDTVVAVDDDEEEEAEQTNVQLHKSVHCSLSTLCDWYNTMVRGLNIVGAYDFTLCTSNSMSLFCSQCIFPDFFRNPTLVHLEKSVVLLPKMNSSSLPL